MIGIDPGSSLVMRTEPRHGAGEVARYGNGQWLEPSCWTTGDPDADGHGYRYWMQVSTPRSWGYVNDWYLDTGGPNTWKSQLLSVEPWSVGQTRWANTTRFAV
ncbi:hypothetical protein ACFCYF_28105 [Streptomyces chartreusis]|uniref:hypothetical protein n=1 Tax=Streptomyces chartreusis TaxID=1969 RepID=UPI0035D71670